MKISSARLSRFSVLALLVVAFGVFALASTASATVSSNITWTSASGASATPIGKKVAFYVWHVGTTVTLVTTGTTTAGHKDTGQFIITGGTISHLTTSKLEKGDKVSVDKTGSVVTFNFTTAKGTDALHFIIKGGTSLKLEVAHDGAESTNLIFYGKKATAASANPVYFNLKK